ncbi:MAG TPA: ABC transporter ATP-binding protein [Myxococcota bacterium]|nr:ABC transporter ATP-binding protein [Myxococcota bacterium]
MIFPAHAKQKMSPENVIEVRSASMHYVAYKSRRRSLREAVFRTALRKDERVDVWALKDVSFEVKHGESLGIIGDNGAGKSTLCLLLSKIMEPTSGMVEVDGRVSALLTLGAGFQGDLTGRDNMFLNGVYLGFTVDEMREKMDEIIEFAEIREFIDMPVRTYSSGMRMRLAFSIAASVKPEILIIDELMGVGDRKFQKKSTARMKELMSESKALVVVSHNMGTIRDLCTRAVWLEKGMLIAAGSVEEVIASYEAR